MIITWMAAAELIFINCLRVQRFIISSLHSILDETGSRKPGSLYLHLTNVFVFKNGIAVFTRAVQTGTHHGPDQNLGCNTDVRIDSPNHRVQESRDPVGYSLSKTRKARC